MQEQETDAPGESAKADAPPEEEAMLTIESVSGGVDAATDKDKKPAEDDVVELDDDDDEAGGKGDDAEKEVR